MKISISLTLFILVAAAGFGWHLDEQLTAARKDASHLTAETARHGTVVIDPLSPRTSKRVRVDHKAVAKKLADEYIQLSKLTGKDGKLDQAAQARLDECWKQISALNADSLKTICDRLLVSPELNEKERSWRLIAILRLVLVPKNPRVALDFVMENHAEVKEIEQIESVVSTALGVMAKDDPQAAVKWITENAAAFPQKMLTYLKSPIWCSAAETNPSGALSSLAGLGLHDMELQSAMIDIVKTAKTEEEMTATLAALRECRKANESNKALQMSVDQTISYFSDNLRKASFEAATKWIHDANLNPQELGKICSRLNGGMVEDTGKWIEWMDTTLPEEKRASHITDRMWTWTHDDYEAAGKWLASAPEGNAKNAAILGYAEVVFKHDRKAAVQWLMTLPPGKERDSAFKKIHMNWPKDDPTGKEAFKIEHGLK